MLAALAWGVGLIFLTEGLSLCHGLTAGPLLLAWLIVNASLGFALWRMGSNASWRLPQFPRDPFVRACAVAVGGLLGLTLAAALFSPPNTPDVLSYHLPRQLFWLQQGGVQHFITADDRVLMMPPLAEMIQAHALGLSHGDHWANVPQWLAYALGLVVVSLLARELGATRRGQWLATLMFAALPMSYLEASSAKNDLLVAVWLGVFTWLALRKTGASQGSAGLLTAPAIGIRNSGSGIRSSGAGGPPALRRPIAEWAAIGAALGLALATKPTAIIFALPVLIAIALPLLRDARGIAVISIVVLAIVGPHWARNQAWYGSPLGVHQAKDGGEQENTTFSWRSVVSNAARNSALHLATPSPALNHQIESAIARFHKMIGQDLTDPRTTLLTLDFEVAWRPRSEVTAGSFVQCLLGVATLISLLVLRKWRGAPMQLLAIIVGSLLLYCLLLKWQPWGARLQLPAFLCGTALVAWMAETFGAAVCWAAAALALVGWLPSAECDIRPLWSGESIFAKTRWENYFRTHPDDQARTEACLRTLAGAKVNSVKVISKNGVPYPLMRRFLDDAGGRAEFWVADRPSGLVPPEAIVVIDRFGAWLPLYLHPNGTNERYRASGVTDPFGVYLPEAKARALPRRLPLPNFVGWDDATGLGPLIPAYVDRATVEVRKMNASTMSLRFRPEASRMQVRLEVANLTAVPVHAELRLNGVRIAGLQFEALSPPQAVKVPIALSGAPSELTLLTTDAASESLIFLKIQIFDY
ncbi:MAG: hypothetical protein JWM32_282 [Verrucomicrobia bacterium]|nr:hypothetical protein [Verrucomicrobiota bacterium]